MTIHAKYIQRCLELAKLGAGYVAPNPMVGAVLVYEDRIIGEGWHNKYGEAHAEVNCINQALQNGQIDLIQRSTLYVSLEPCAHFGKTAPCTDLIIKNKIPKVVIGCRDPFKEVDGKGIEKLKAAGVEVELADRLLKYECEKLNKRFFTFHREQRPYIILKWAQTEDGFIAPLAPEGEALLNPPQGGTLDSDTNNDINGLKDSKNPPSEGREARLLISNEYSNRLVHQWRSQEAAILVGTNTALLDDPELTNRLWKGPSPVRLVIDMKLRLPKTLKLFDGQQATIVFNGSEQTIPENTTAELLKQQGGLWYYKVKPGLYPLKEIMKALYQLQIQSVLVEGGAKLLQSFIDEELWDEIRVIENGKLKIENGLMAPKLENAILCGSEQLFSDSIETYFPSKED